MSDSSPIDPPSRTFTDIVREPHALWRSGVLAALSAGLAIACLTSGDLSRSTEDGVRMDLPGIVGGYSGESQEISLSERTILPLDTNFVRKLYHTFDGDQINCQIVLSGGEKRSIHRPEICLPGQGWTVKTGTIVPIALESGQTLDVMRLLLSRPMELRTGEKIELKSVFLYWFVGKDKTTARHWRRVLSSSWDRVFHNTQHRWAYIVVSATVTEGLQSNGKNEAGTFGMLEDFIRDLTPYMHKDAVVPGP